MILVADHGDDEYLILDDGCLSSFGTTINERGEVLDLDKIRVVDKIKIDPRLPPSGNRKQRRADMKAHGVFGIKRGR